jgi:hypothetical protein
MLVRVSAACNGLSQELARARELWASAGSESYSYLLSTAASDLDIVVKDGVASAVEGTSTSAPTIPALFDQIEGTLEVLTASVTYDAMLGYPREVDVLSSGCSGDADYAYAYSFAVADLVLE